MMESGQRPVPYVLAAEAPVDAGRRGFTVWLTMPPIQRRGYWGGTHRILSKRHVPLTELLIRSWPFRYVSGDLRRKPRCYISLCVIRVY